MSNYTRKPKSVNKAKPLHYHSTFHNHEMTSAQFNGFTLEQIGIDHILTCWAYSVGGYLPKDIAIIKKHLSMYYGMGNKGMAHVEVLEKGWILTEQGYTKPIIEEAIDNLKIGSIGVLSSSYEQKNSDRMQIGFSNSLINKTPDSTNRQTDRQRLTDCLIQSQNQTLTSSDIKSESVESLPKEEEMKIQFKTKYQERDEEYLTEDQIEKLTDREMEKHYLSREQLLRMLKVDYNNKFGLQPPKAMVDTWESDTEKGIDALRQSIATNSRM